MHVVIISVDYVPLIACDYEHLDAVKNSIKERTGWSDQDISDHVQVKVMVLNEY